MQRLQAGVWERAVSLAAVAGVLWAVATVWAQQANPLRLAGLLVAVVAIVGWAVHAWRWRIVVDDEGLTLQPAFGRRRRLAWQELAGADEQAGGLRLREGQTLRFNGIAAPALSGGQRQVLRATIARFCESSE